LGFTGRRPIRYADQPANGRGGKFFAAGREKTKTRDRPRRQPVSRCPAGDNFEAGLPEALREAADAHGAHMSGIIEEIEGEGPGRNAARLGTRAFWDAGLEK